MLRLGGPVLIKNRELCGGQQHAASAGLLRLSTSSSPSGFYAEVSTSVSDGQCTEDQWQLEPAEDGAFTLRSRALTPGTLTYTVRRTWALYGGRFVQALDTAGEALYGYGPGGGARRSVLWRIAEADDGWVVITNCDFGRPLTYADDKSPDGYHAQVLTGGDSRYEPGGRWRNCALWAILPPPA